MKKILLFLILLGCGKNDNNQSSNFKNETAVAFNIHLFIINSLEQNLGDENVSQINLINQKCSGGGIFSLDGSQIVKNDNGVNIKNYNVNFNLNNCNFYNSGNSTTLTGRVLVGGTGKKEISQFKSLEVSYQATNLLIINVGEISIDEKCNFTYSYSLEKQKLEGTLCSKDLQTN